MTGTVDLLLSVSVHDRLVAHLFPGDGDEHAAVIGAGVVVTDRGTRLLARDLFLAEEGSDYRPSARGYKALHPTFIHRALTHCRDQHLAYLAIHNHGGRGSVAFSAVDMESHRRGYPALLDIAEGMPVGALVVADGAMEIDLWPGTGNRQALREARVIGRPMEYIYPNARSRSLSVGDTPLSDHAFARQVLLLGATGQARLGRLRVGIIGLGGVGALVNEYLARLGVGELILIDPDRLELSNLSRIVGARLSDLTGNGGRPRSKVAIAAGVAADAPRPPRAQAVDEDVAYEAAALQLKGCDFLFLAADSMRARLVFNAIVHQYYVPGIQLGSKVSVGTADGKVEQAFSVVRSVLPGEGCLLCNGLIDAAELAREWMTRDERRQADYGSTLPSPSVITMNAVAAAHGVNEFLFSVLGLRARNDRAAYLRFDHLTGRTAYDRPRKDPTCTECSPGPSSRLGRGDAVRLPCGVGASEPPT